MNLTTIPFQVVAFFLVQTCAVIWFFIKLYFKVEAMSKKVNELDSENKELKKQLKDISDTLLLVKHTTDLLYLGKIKTTRQEAA